MKNLTAGIFAAIMMFVAATSANAEIASKGYVDGRVDGVSNQVQEVQSSVNEFKTNIGNTINNQITEVLKEEDNALVQAINSKADKTYVDQQLGTKATVQSVTDLSTRVDGKQDKLTDAQTAAIGQVETIAGDVGALKTDVASNKAALGTLNGGAQVVGSVANQIATATNGMLTETVANGKYATTAQFNALNTTVTDEATGLAATLEIANQGVTDAAAAQNAAQTAQTTANAAQAAATNAQTTANAAIPKPAGECTNPANKCVLTFAGGTTYAWEVIARGDAE